jgi:hypothetical protein
MTASNCATVSPSIALGSVLAILGRPINGIGFIGISSLAKRKVQMVFHVDQHRRMDAGS